MECHSLCRFLGDVLEIYRHCPFSTIRRGITVSYETVNLLIVFFGTRVKTLIKKVSRLVELYDIISTKIINGNTRNGKSMKHAAR